MLWLQEYTDKIRSHLSAGDPKSLTYAALEARLALERVCYERLRIAHKYISSDDLRTWKPQYVVQTVMEMVDPKIASEWQLQIGSKPDDDSSEFIPIGTQKGFDPKYINQLWQAMSSFLHCDVPRESTQSISHYKPQEKMKQKIEETLCELDRIAEGSMMGALVLRQINFECVCGQINGRSAIVLRNDDIVNCVKEGCKEQYRIEKKDDEFFFERRVQHVECHKCGTKDRFKYREFHDLRKDQAAWFFCTECGEKNTFMWRLMQVKRKEAD